MYAEIAPKLFDNGWRNLLPLGVYADGRKAADTKGCFIKGWSRRSQEPLTREGLKRCVKRYPKAGIGCAFGPSYNLVAVDLDVEDEKQNARAREVIVRTLPETKFQRIGKPPKILFLYRGNVPTKKPQGLGVEIFGHSCQTALFAIHPKTQEPYTWPFRSPLDCGPDELPLVEQPRIDDFLHEWAAVAPRSGRRYSGGGSQALDIYDALARERRIDGAEAAARQLMNVAPGERHPTLLSVVGYLVSTSRTDDEIAAFVDDFFASDCRHDGFENPAAMALAMAETARAKFYEERDWELKE